jgi:hypothetical protein
MPLAILAFIIGSIINLFDCLHKEDALYSASLLVMVGPMLLFIWFYARSFALKAQDRGIRAEENFRHFVLTGKPLDSRLHTYQVVALRFASDAELPALASRAANENMKPGDIKKAIVNWRGDFHRV